MLTQKHGLAIVGSVIIALNGPQEQAVTTITEFQHLFLSPGFLVYGSVLIIAALVIIFFFAPKYVLCTSRPSDRRLMAA